MVTWLQILAAFVYWNLNKAIPEAWHHHVDAQQTRIEQAKDLCDNHGDCEAEKIQALQGLKPVPETKRP